MIDPQQLCKFLVKAKTSTYAAGEKAPKVVEADTSTSYIIEEGDWKYHDNYFGGEPFGGREVVFYQRKPVWMMVYYGRVDDSVSDFGPVYKFLQKALTLMPENHPYRGPTEYNDGDLSYTNSYQGNVGNFYGEETISRAGTEIYKAMYIGGFVDQRT